MQNTGVRESYTRLEQLTKKRVACMICIQIMEIETPLVFSILAAIVAAGGAD